MDPVPNSKIHLPSCQGIRNGRCTRSGLDGRVHSINRSLYPSWSLWSRACRVTIAAHLILPKVDVTFLSADVPQSLASLLVHVGGRADVVIIGYQ